VHSGSVASRSTEPRIGNGPSRLPTTAPQGDAARRTNGTSVDAVSLAIIEQLQEDGRRPYAAIGKAVGLSEAAVRQRVQKLLDQGVMQIVAVTDPLTVGFRRQAMVGIRVEGDLDPVAEALTAMAECEYVVMTAGSFDLMVEVVCEDDDHLLEVINKRIRALPGVRSTESFVYLKLKKQTYMWGTR
jgi:Lrp/AsnC family transcriptional regulator for asnA, asnC and gidA